MAHSFDAKVVFVTGGTSGIGQATVRAFAGAGAHVYFCARREELGRSQAKVLRNEGFSVYFKTADVKDPGAIESVVNEAVRRHGCLDIAVNNAGINHAPFLAGDTPADVFNDVLATNVIGVQNAMRAELPILTRPGGVIINIASVLSEEGANWMSAYGASKHAVWGLTRSAAMDYRRQGIRICAVSPGPVKTPMFDKAMEDIAGDKSKYAGGLPRGGVLAAEDVADLILNIAHEDSEMKAGDNVFIDPRKRK